MVLAMCLPVKAGDWACLHGQTAADMYMML